MADKNRKIAEEVLTAVGDTLYDTSVYGNSFLAVMVSSVLIYPDVITLLGSNIAQAGATFGVSSEDKR